MCVEVVQRDGQQTLQLQQMWWAVLATVVMFPLNR
jgi:hypothetical protein